MAWFFDPIDDLVVGVMRRVGRLGICKGQRNSGVIFADLWAVVGVIRRGGFELCPLSPEVETGGVFEHICDVSAADAGSNLEQIKFPVRLALQKLGVRDAAADNQMRTAVERLAFRALYAPSNDTKRWMK